MLSCRLPIVFNAPHEAEQIDVYLASDMHVGSSSFNEKKWGGFEKLLAAPNSYVLFCGDQMEMATRSSKSDCYTQTMRPHEQKVWWKDHLLPYKDKIIAIIDGNHEYNRASKDADMFPLYDIAFALGIENRYRSESAFVDIGVGLKEKKRNQHFRYFGYMVHKAQNLTNYGTADTIDGIDFFVSGHTHKSMDKPLGKLVYDPKNKTVSERSVENIVCGSFLTYDGYAARNAYRAGSQKLYKLVLDGTRKAITTVGFYV